MSLSPVQNTKFNNKEQLISVIMPVYNAEKYLERSIGSVVSQSYKNWELLIVDDGSTDDSVSIVLSWTEKESRIRLIQNQHGGTAITRNTALDQAMGEYIAFLDADDAYHPEYLTYLYRAIIQNQADISMCSIVRDTDFEGFLKSERNADFKVIDSNKACEMMYRGGWMDMISSCNKLYRHDVFKEVRFPEGMYFEDVATIHRTIFKADRLALTEEQLYFYNITPNSSSVTKRSEELLDREKALRSHWELYEKENRQDLVSMAIPFYLTEITKTHFKLGLTDRPRDQEIVADRFRDTYKKYKRKVTFTEDQREQITAFLHPVVYDIRNMIREDGLVRTGLGFIKRKIKQVGKI